MGPILLSARIITIPITYCLSNVTTEVDGYSVGRKNNPERHLYKNQLRPIRRSEILTHHRRRNIRDVRRIPAWRFIFIN